MGIFDKLKNKAAQGLGDMVSGAIGNKSEQIVFSALPESVEQMKALPEATLDTPFKTAALTVAALCAYAADAAIGTEMLNFLKGPQPLSAYEQSFLKDRFRDKTYVPFSYFEGATPANNYTPSEPFKLTVSTGPYSDNEAGYYKVFVTSGGADSPRSIKLRQKGQQWFLWEQFLLADIRIPASDDPWA